MGTVRGDRKKVKTGVFFHPEFSHQDWPIIGNKYRNFPGVMERALSLEGVKLFESKPVPEELLLRVHTENYLKDVKKAWYYPGATLTVGGCMEASEKIAEGEITNALVFAVAARGCASSART